MIQLLIVIGLFLLAAFWMGRRLYHGLRGSQGGSCESCAMSKSVQKSDVTTSSDL